MSEILSVINQDKRTLRKTSSEIGVIGERLASAFLIEEAYRLVIANFKVPIGRNTKGVQVTGEIDLVALDGETLCFIEVKTRQSASFAGPLAAVDLRKQRQITRTARMYRKIFNLKDISYRFDVVTVLLEKDIAPEIELIKGFWHEAKFRKRAWSGDIF
jgi:putative endonuclease